MTTPPPQKKRKRKEKGGKGSGRHSGEGREGTGRKKEGQYGRSDQWRRGGKKGEEEKKEGTDRGSRLFNCVAEEENKWRKHRVSGQGKEKKEAEYPYFKRGDSFKTKGVTNSASCRRESSRRNLHSMRTPSLRFIQITSFVCLITEIFFFNSKTWKFMQIYRYACWEESRGGEG